MLAALHGEEVDTLKVTAVGTVTLPPCGTPVLHTELHLLRGRSRAAVLGLGGGGQVLSLQVENICLQRFLYGALTWASPDSSLFLVVKPIHHDLSATRGAGLL